MTEQPTALRLADALETAEISYISMVRAAAELRRLHAQRDALLEALKAAEPYLRHADVAYNVYVQARAAIKAVEGEKA